MEQIQATIKTVCRELFDIDIEPQVTRPSEQFGDYSTNVALQLATYLKNKPQDIANQLVDKLRDLKVFKSIDIAGPGFINITLADAVLCDQLETALTEKDKYGESKLFADAVVVAEYSDPNPFKVLHAGHLYTSIVGDAIANLLEVAGAQVHRVNFGGDVGLHVGRAMWAILKYVGGENPDALKAVPVDKRADWLSERYVEGNKADETSTTAKAEIAAVNKRIYQLHTENDHTSAFAVIYWECREWSYDYFKRFYTRIGIDFEKYYPESSVADLGLKVVKEQLAKGVFEKSDGAIVYKGEQNGLHTRVFITSQGLPTYETKDLGLAIAKWQDYHFDKSIIITANDITEYMKVVLAALEHFMPEIPERTTHLTHGVVKLQGGEKMSSRRGNILRAVDILDAAADANQEATGKQDEGVELGAVRYAFLKQRTGGDIIYDPQESVSLQGNSGPYLQYAYARANSILRKVPQINLKSPLGALQADERSLVRKISEYPEIVEKAATEFMPHHICTYLYELAQTFNRFYENSKVIGDPREDVRLAIVTVYAQVLKNGLRLLNIAAPEQM